MSKRKLKWEGTFMEERALLERRGRVCGKSVKRISERGSYIQGRLVKRLFFFSLCNIDLFSVRIFLYLEEGHGVGRWNRSGKCFLIL